MSAIVSVVLMYESTVKRKKIEKFKGKKNIYIYIYLGWGESAEQ